MIDDVVLSWLRFYDAIYTAKIENKNKLLSTDSTCKQIKKKLSESCPLLMRKYQS